MKTTRREFLKNGALAAAGTTLVSNSLFSCGSGTSSKQAAATAEEAVAANDQVVAVQLYCVREDMKKDPLATLTKLAEMGYKHVEHADYNDRKFYGYPAVEFKKVLGDMGMQMPSGHTVLGKDHWDAGKNDFTDEWKYTIEDAATMGQKFVVSPWLDNSFWSSYDALMGFLEVFNKCGELCQQSGMKFGYHNHDFEFSEILNGEVMFDIMLKNTDPDKVGIQLDVGNMYIAGAKAKDIILKYPGRFETIHVKDMIKSESEDGHGFESTILGKGLVGTREVTDMSKEQGTWLFIIEQESYQGKTPLECMKEDLEIINQWGYV
jgi:sugar phosphate isomerase/epimerase